MIASVATSQNWKENKNKKPCPTPFARNKILVNLGHTGRWGFHPDSPFIFPGIFPIY
jgi:hypothetical protein